MSKSFQLGLPSVPFCKPEIQETKDNLVLKIVINKQPKVKGAEMNIIIRECKTKETPVTSGKDRKAAT